MITINYAKVPALYRCLGFVVGAVTVPPIFEASARILYSRSGIDLFGFSYENTSGDLFLLLAPALYFLAGGLIGYRLAMQVYCRWKFGKKLAPLLFTYVAVGALAGLLTAEVVMRISLYIIPHVNNLSVQVERLPETAAFVVFSISSVVVGSFTGYRLHRGRHVHQA